MFTNPRNRRFSVRRIDQTRPASSFESLESRQLMSAVAGADLLHEGMQTSSAIEYAAHRNKPTVLATMPASVGARATASSARRADLAQYRPRGWSNNVVTTNQPGSRISSDYFYDDQDLCLSWAIVNQGKAASKACATTLYIDGTLIGQWRTPALGAGRFSAVKDVALGRLSAGTHSIKIVADSDHTMNESSFNNNTFNRTITVEASGAPDLAFAQPAGWSDKIIVSNQTGDTSGNAVLYNNQNLYINWAIVNQGNADVAGDYVTAVYVDGYFVTSVVTGGLAAGQTIVQSDVSLGQLSAGTHTIQICTDADDDIGEGDESNNSFTRTITVSAAAPPPNEPAVDGNVTQWVDFSGNPLFGPQGPKADDVQQGYVGDCYFVAALAEAAAIDPALIRQDITAMSGGKYCVTFWSGDSRTGIVVDGFLPEDAWGNLEYAKLGDSSCTWVAIMEKAFACYRDSGSADYANIEAGSLDEGLQVIGGSDLRDFYTSQMRNGNDLAARISAELNAGRAVDLGTVDSFGLLAGNHAYSVMNVRYNADGSSDILVRNPWGCDTQWGSAYTWVNSNQLYAHSFGITSAIV